MTRGNVIPWLLFRLQLFRLRVDNDGVMQITRGIVASRIHTLKCRVNVLRVGYKWRVFLCVVWKRLSGYLGCENLFQERTRVWTNSRNAGGILAKRKRLIWILFSLSLSALFFAVSERNLEPKHVDSAVDLKDEKQQSRRIHLFCGKKHSYERSRGQRSLKSF